MEQTDRAFIAELSNIGYCAGQVVWPGNSTKVPDDFVPEQDENEAENDYQYIISGVLIGAVVAVTLLLLLHNVRKHRKQVVYGMVPSMLHGVLHRMLHGLLPGTSFLCSSRHSCNHFLHTRRSWHWMSR